LVAALLCFASSCSRSLRSFIQLALGHRVAPKRKKTSKTAIIEIELRETNEKRKWEEQTNSEEEANSLFKQNHFFRQYLEKRKKVVNFRQANYEFVINRKIIQNHRQKERSTVRI